MDTPKTLTLARSPSRFNALATFGILYDGNAPFAVTMEPSTPIIPAGTYLCTKYWSPAHQHWTFRINNVPGHEGVEIHTGVFPTDTKGCVIVAKQAGIMTYKGTTGDGVGYSSMAYTEMVQRIGGKDIFYLEVV
jgi:hypothetical protein